VRHTGGMLCFFPGNLLPLEAGTASLGLRAHRWVQQERHSGRWRTLPQPRLRHPFWNVSERARTGLTTATRAGELVALAKKGRTRAKRKPGGGDGATTGARQQPAGAPRQERAEQAASRTHSELEPQDAENWNDENSHRLETEPNYGPALNDAEDGEFEGRNGRHLANVRSDMNGSGALQTDERHELLLEQPQAEEALQKLLSGISLRSNQELLRVAQALQLSADKLRRNRAPMSYQFRELLVFAEKLLLRDEDLSRLENARAASTGEPPYAAVQRVALQGLSEQALTAVAANRHYFDNRFFYGLSASRLLAEHRGNSEERDRLTLLAFRAQQSVRIIDAPLMRALNHAERTVQMLLDTVLGSSVETLEYAVDSIIGEVSAADLEAIWLVLYAAAAAWEIRRLQDPRTVNHSVVQAIVYIRRQLRTRDVYREKLPLDFHWLTQVALAVSPQDEELLLRSPPNLVETTARVGGLAAALAQTTSNAYIALSRVFSTVYDSLRRLGFEVGDVLEDADDIISSPQIEIREPKVRSRFEKFSVDMIEAP
jgi:hypothetical protein